GQEMWENRPELFQWYSNAADFTKWERKADVATFAENGRTYVPMRFLAYALGATDKDVTWDDKTQTVKIVLKTAGDPAKTVTVTLKVGSKTLLKDGQAVAMDVAPLARDGRVFLPARFVAEAAGYAVSYDEDYQGVLVGPSGDKMPVHPKRMTPPDRPEVIIPEDGGEVIIPGVL
ncbi:MAG: copper amine oxidase N-terminal domain-containing protein, partial [Bacillota bacterium]